MKPILKVTCGIPASGKSTWAKHNAELTGAILLSSDQLREELFGDANNQEKNAELFQELYKRAKELLNNGKDVIIDATNINQKKRMHLCREFKNFEKNLVYFPLLKEEAIERDNQRERKVGERVIDRMYLNFQFPTIEEGWDNIVYTNNNKREDESFYEENQEVLKEVIGVYGHDGLFISLIDLFDSNHFKAVYNLPHDSKYHQHTVSEHIYQVFDYVRQNYQGQYKYELMIASIYHDVGKYVAKSFVDFKGTKKENAHFIGHESVSSQITFQELTKIFNFPISNVILICNLVQNHMKLLNDPQGKQKQKLEEMYGQEFVSMLEFLREADTQAH